MRMIYITPRFCLWEKNILHKIALRIRITLYLTVLLNLSRAYHQRVQQLLSASIRYYQ